MSNCEVGMYFDKYTTNLGIIGSILNCKLIFYSRFIDSGYFVKPQLRIPGFIYYIVLI